MSLMNPTETATPVQGAMPPTSQRRSLGECLQEALALISEDREFAPDEQMEVSAFLQGVKMVAEGRAMQGRPMMGAPSQMQKQPGAGGPPQSETEDYGAVQGAEPKTGGY